MYARNEKVVPIPIEREMKDSYISYAMSVIAGRALPDARDGLKPVHRRILYAMQELGLEHTKPYKKSARIVGEVLGKYHPHGDIAVYDALVRMAQTFSMRYPLVEGQGNFGSVDGDSPAAMRYCVTGDTLIVTDRGLVPIRDLSPDGSETIRLSILSRDRTVNEANKWFDSGEHQTLKATTSRGYAVQGSYNHPILTWTADENSGRPAFQWKLLSQLQVGDVAVIDRTTNLLWPEKPLMVETYWPSDLGPRVEPKTLPHTLDENLAWLLGAFVSEGSVHEQELEFCNSDAAWLEEFDRRWQQVFPDCRLHQFVRRPSSFGKKPYATREIHSRRVVALLRKLGLEPVKSRQKTIPWSVLRSPKSVVAAFLQAYFEGDGSISASGPKMIELSCVSASETLIDQLQVALLRFGIASTKRYDRYRAIHKLYIRGLENYRLFQTQIGFVSKHKNEKLACAIAPYSKEYSATDFVPFISDFTRSHLDPHQLWREGRDFVLKHNFDRYANLERHAPRVVATVEPKTRPATASLFERLLETRYLFDPIVEIKKGGMARVYSIKVESACHSFVANGFINHNTEVRLAAVAESVLADLEKDTVDFAPNFDESLQEPRVLPSALPNLLVNGSSGIAVGMATNIPPHNLQEIAEGVAALIDNPEITVKELTKIIKGPDFPTGGAICGRAGLLAAYQTGRGSLKVRAIASIEEQKSGKQTIVVTEIPYQVNKATLLEAIAALVSDKKLEGISDLRDESDKDGMRIVIELKRDANAQVVLNQLYKHTQLETSFGVIMLALVENRPRVLTLKQLLEVFVRHRETIVVRRTKFELKRAQDRAHILEGLKIALAHLDAIIKLIRRSRSDEEARVALMKEYDLSQVQAQAILDMQLKRLTALEREKLEQEYLELIKKIELYKAILASEKKILAIVKEETQVLAQRFGDERRTQLVAEAEELEIEDLIAEEDVVITISHAGYIKRLPVSAYRKQRRGGKGVAGAEIREEDFIEDLFIASTHDHILVFTDKGRVYWLRVYDVPQSSRQAKGKAIINLVQLQPGERLAACIPVREFKDDQHLVMVTQNGLIKKTSLSEYGHPRRGGIVGMGLEAGDALIEVAMTDGHQELLLATRQGKAIRFPESQVRDMGRAAKGVRGIGLAKKDIVVGVALARKETTVLTITEGGFGKRTPIADYRVQSRGGQGIINIKVTERNGAAVALKAVTDKDELMIIAKQGQIVRCPVKDIRTTGRAAQGVRIIRLASGDRVASVAHVVPDEEDAAPALAST